MTAAHESAGAQAGARIGLCKRERRRSGRGKPERRRFAVPGDREGSLGTALLDARNFAASGGFAPLGFHVFRRLVEAHLLVDLADPVQRNEMMLAAGRIVPGELDLV